MAIHMSSSTIPEPVVPPVVDDPPPEVPPTVPIPEPDPTHSPVLPTEEPSGRARPRPPATPSAEVPDPDTYEALYEEARKRKIRGRSTMSKTELARALGR